MINKEEQRMLDISFEQIKQSDVVDSIDKDIVLMTVEGMKEQAIPVKNESIILVYCTAGEAMLDVNARSFRICSGDVLFVFANSVLSNYHGSPDFKGKCMFLAMHPLKESFRHERSFVERIFCLGKNPVIRLSLEQREVLENYYRMLSVRLDSPSIAYHREVVRALIQAMLYELLSYMDGAAELSGTEILRQGDILFKRFVELVSKSKVKSRFVYDYADKLHVSTKYLSAVCKNICGKTATAIINEFVVEDIRRMLKYSDKSIKEISQELDFPNISFFGKYVKAHLGVSPKAYREMR